MGDGIGWNTRRRSLTPYRMKAEEEEIRVTCLCIGRLHSVIRINEEHRTETGDGEQVGVSGGGKELGLVEVFWSG